MASKSTVRAKMARGVYPSAREIKELMEDPRLKALVSRAFDKMKPLGVSYSPDPRAKFVHFTIESKRKFDPAGFRRIRTDGTQITIGCPVGKFNKATQRCRVGTRAQSILVPKTRVFGAIARYIGAPVIKPARKLAANPYDSRKEALIARIYNVVERIARRTGMSTTDVFVEYGIPGKPERLPYEDLRDIYDSLRGITMRIPIKEPREMFNRGKYKKNPLLMTIGLNPPERKRRNPAPSKTDVTYIKVPFRPGQTVKIERFENWLYNSGYQMLIKEYKEVMAKSIEFHKHKKPNYKPIEILIKNIDFGDNINGVKIFYSMGTAEHSVYKVPKHSGKHFKGAWKHEWKTQPHQLTDASGKTIVMPLEGTAKITRGWMHG